MATIIGSGNPQAQQFTEDMQKDAFQACVGLFGMAVGTAYLDAIADFMTSDANITIDNLYDVLVTSEVASQFGYHSYLTPAGFANKLASNLLPASISADAASAFKAAVVAALDYGYTKAQVAKLAVEAVAAVPADDPNYGPARAQLDNRVAVAEYYTLTVEGGSTNLSTLTNLLSSITEDEATVEAGKESIDNGGGDIGTGQTFSLTVGVDNIIGGASNDTIIGAWDPVNSLHTLSGLDSIDGGAGNDTLNLTDSAGGKINFTGVTIKNVETLNVHSVGALAAGMESALDLTKVATGLTSANINVAEGAALTVTAATTTKLNVTNDHDVTIVGGGGALVIDTDGDVVVGKNAGPGAADINALTSVSVTQVLASNKKADITDNSGTKGAIGSKLTSVTLDGVGAASTLTGDGINTLSLTNSDIAVTVTNTKAHTLGLTVNSVATGASVVDGTATAVNVTTTGTAADGKDSAFFLDVAKAATITVTGAGDVELEAAGADYTALTTFNYTGSGSVTADLKDAAALTKVVAGSASGAAILTVDGAVTSVTTGSGDDSVTIDGTTTTDFKGTLSLGAGSDVVTVANGAVITADAVIDAGDGIDTLSLGIVGVANVASFKNFERFDVAGISADFDQDVLNTNNTVENFIGTATLGGSATLQNLGAGVGFIVTGDMGGTQTLTLTQATAGALTITSDVDSIAGAGAVTTQGELFVASNATSVTAAFNNDNVDKAASTAQLDITGTKATSLNIVSGGSNVTNTLNYTGAASGGNDLLTSVTITGDQALAFDYTTGGGTLKLATVDAAGQTAGGLTFSLDDLTATGTLKLGGGDDIISFDTAITTSAATSATVVTINGLQKGTEEGLAAQDGFDVLVFSGAVQAADISGAAATTAGFSVADGKVTWLGAGPANLAAAITLLDTTLDDDEAVVFNFAGTHYIYGAGASAAGGAGTDMTDDLLVKVTGVSSINGLDTAGAGNIYLF